jgi:acetyl-CoA C-acetyltransferase
MLGSEQLGRAPRGRIDRCVCDIVAFRVLNKESFVMTDPIVIASAVRTPIGGMLGDFSALAAHQLGSVAIRAAVERAGVPADAVDEVLMGNCLMAGQGQAPARQAALGAGLPQSAGAVTLSKMCGSGMRAMMFANDMLKAESAEVVVAGGMESMTNAPHLMFARKRALRRRPDVRPPGARRPRGCVRARPGDGRIRGGLRRPVLLQARGDGQLRDQLDRARQEGQRGRQLRVGDGAGGRSRQGGRDPDQVRRAAVQAKLDKIPGLKAAFKKEGTITAATSSSISDGAAALVLMRESTAARLGSKPIALIAGHSVHAEAPGQFTTAPIGAIAKLLKRTGWGVHDADLWEVDEAFAAVTMAAMTEFKLAHEIVNVHGGAVALGHPIGASGARIVVTLLGALKKYGKKKGVAALCIGGGEATALALELV